jgi:hypothetical protein
MEGSLPFNYAGVPRADPRPGGIQKKKKSMTMTLKNNRISGLRGSERAPVLLPTPLKSEGVVDNEFRVNSEGVKAGTYTSHYHFRERLSSKIEYPKIAMGICPICERQLANERGVRIHIGRMHKEFNTDNHRGPSGASVVQSSQAMEEHHLTRDDVSSDFTHKHVEGNLEENIKEQIKKKSDPLLPHPSDKRKWAKWDQVICDNLRWEIGETEWAQADLNQLAHDFESSVYSSLISLGGERPEYVRKQTDRSKGSRELQRIKKEKKALRKEWRLKKASGAMDVKETFKKLSKVLRLYSKSVKISKAFQDESKAHQDRNDFRKNPFKFGKKLLDPTPTGKPNFTKEEADMFFSASARHPDRGRKYTPPFELPRPKKPQYDFETAAPNGEELEVAVAKRSIGSGAGINGIRFLVYKRCPGLRKFLGKLCERAWIEKVIPLVWRLGRAMLLAKSDDTSHPELMRRITILNAEARIFWAMFHNRLLKYMIQNRYQNLSVQKAFTPGVPGCIEHGTMHEESFDNAKRYRRAICATWLDLHKAYGSLAHMMIQFTLEWYHIPTDMQELVFRYYEEVLVRIFTSEWEGEVFRQEKGVLEGCTTSTSLFNLSFQMLLDIHEHLTGKQQLGYHFKEANFWFTRPTFADDIGLYSGPPKDCQTSVDAFCKGLAWSRTLRVNVPKCVSYAAKASKTGDYSAFDPLITIQQYDEEGTEIGPRERIQDLKSYKGDWFKYLGFKKEDENHKGAVKRNFEARLVDYMDKIDKSRLLGSMKAWTANFLAIPKLTWELLSHKFTPTQVSMWQKRVNKFYKKWMQLKKPTENGILYRRNTSFGLGFKNLEEINRMSQVTKWHIMKSSLDANARALFDYKLAQDRKGKRPSPCLVIEDAETRLRHRQMFGGQTDKKGIGARKKQSMEQTSKQKRQQVLQIVKDDAERERIDVLDNYEMQANWKTYGLNNTMQADLTWAKMLYTYSDELLKFVLNATANTLNSPDNLRRWGCARGLVCICGKPDVTLKHILAGCPWVYKWENKATRTEDRYTWRHNCVLLALSKHIERKVDEANGKQRKSTKKQLFVKEGTIISAKARWEAKANAKIQESILGLATDWNYNFDLPEYHEGKYNNLVFPHEVTPTVKRVDGYLISRQEKLCVLGPEITSPMDDNVMMWHAKKTEKYRKMVAKVEGWKFFDFSVEVGALGWIPPSTFGKLKELGFSNKETKMIQNELTYVARMCSYVIFVNRHNKEFRSYRVQSMSKGPFMNRNFDGIPDTVVPEHMSMPKKAVQAKAHVRAQTKVHAHAQTRAVKGGIEERIRNNIKSMKAMYRASLAERIKSGGKSTVIQRKPFSTGLNQLERLKGLQTIYTELYRGEKKAFQEAVEQAKTHSKQSKFKRGTWLETGQIHFILTAMSIHKPEPPTSFDMVNAACKRLEKNGARRLVGSKIVNTDGERGYHYNCLIYSFDEEGAFRAWYQEPLTATCTSKHMSETLSSEFPGAKIDHEPIGFQHDGWSCGYICIWLQLTALHRLHLGQSPFDHPTPKCPEGWVDVCLRLLTTHDLLGNIKNNDLHPRLIGLRPLILDTLLNGNFDRETFMEHINEFERFTC